MKRYIRSARDFSKFTAADKDLWESIDWKARNYEEYEVPEDNFYRLVDIHGVGDDVIYQLAKFVKVIRPNPIYPPYYRPSEDDNPELDRLIHQYKLIGPMHDKGRAFNGYSIHARYETQELYDQLSR